MAYVKCIRNLISSTVPDGKTVTPTDDISIWLACGGRSETYTTLSQVLADSTCLSALISDNNAMDYLVRSTTWASDVCGDSSAMSYIGLNNYASNTLLADSTWCSAICNSTYFESVLNVKVPTMTSNTTPSGECFASTSYASDTQPWMAFDDDRNTYWKSNSETSVSGQYVGYAFNESVKICCIKMFAGTPIYPATDVSFKVQSSNSGQTFTNIAEFLNLDLSDMTIKTFVFALTNNKRFRVLFSSMTTATTYKGLVTTLQFYGRKDV